MVHVHQKPVSQAKVRQGYIAICLWWAFERKLGKKPVTKPKKDARKIKAKQTSCEKPHFF
jgi:hypothetical protein